MYGTMSFNAELYDKLTAYCAYSERCLHDVKEKCKKLEIASDEVPAYISRLEQQGFLNEIRYAKSFIHSKVARKWGLQKIQAALTAKSVKPVIYQPLLAEIENEILIENIKQLVDRKQKTLKSSPSKSSVSNAEVKQKLIRYLMSRGFSYNLIKEVMNNDKSREPGFS